MLNYPQNSPSDGKFVTSDFFFFFLFELGSNLSVPRGLR